MNTMRRFVAFLGVLLLFYPFAGAAYGLNGTEGAFSDETAGDAYIRTDVNQDGCITASDAALLLRAVDVAPQSAILSACDITNNGVADAVDACILTYYCAGLMPDLESGLTAVKTGLCREALFDRFSYTGTISNDEAYRSSNVSVTLKQAEAYGCVYYVADIYIQDIRYLRTETAPGKYHNGKTTTLNMAADADAIIAVSGDYYTQRDGGPIIRNGQVLEKYENRTMDLCVLYDDGVLETYKYGTMDTAEILQKSPAQAWLFGPALLTEFGEAKRTFRSKVGEKNPRCAIGYYEPGHYCFLLADGRQNGYSVGLTLEELSNVMAELGCAAAYNLDGGETAVMATAERVVNRPFRDGRPVSDIIYISDFLPEERAPLESTPDPEQTPIPLDTPEPEEEGGFVDDGEGIAPPEDGPEY